MTDPKNDDFAILIVHSTQDSIRSASCAPDAFQLTSQGSAKSLRVIQYWASYEVDDGKGPISMRREGPYSSSELPPNRLQLWLTTLCREDTNPVGGGRCGGVQDLSYKVRMSTLWLLQGVAFFAYRTIAVSEGATEVSLLSNEDFASYLLVAMGFAFLSLVLPSRLDRLTNLIAGTIFGVIQAIMLADGLTAYPTAVFNLMTGATVVVMAAVVWFAYRWPKAADVVTTTTQHGPVSRRETADF